MWSFWSCHEKWNSWHAIISVRMKSGGGTIVMRTVSLAMGTGVVLEMKTLQWMKQVLPLPQRSVIFITPNSVGRIFPSPKPATSSMRSRRPRPWPGTRHQFPWRHLHCAHIPDQEHNFINWFLNLSHLRQFSYISTNLFSLYEPFPAIQPPHEWALEKNPTSWHGIRSCVYEDQGLARPTHSLFEGFHGRPWSKLCHRLYTEEISIKSLNCLGLSGRTQFKKILFEMKYKIKHLLGRWDGICNMNMIVYSWHYIRMIKRHSFRCKNIVKMLEKTRCHTTTFFIGIVLVKPKCTFLHSVCSLHALLDIFPFIGRNTAVFCYSTLLYFVLYSTVSVLCPYCVCTATVV